MNEKEINAKLEEFLKEKKNIKKNKNEMDIKKYIYDLTNVLRKIEELYNAKVNSKTDKYLIDKIHMERKNILIEIAKELYTLKKYDSCILADKKILKIDSNYHLSYVRLFHSFCNINEPDNGVIYGQMLKGKYDKAFLDKHYPGIIDEINERSEWVAKNYKYFSVFHEMKITPLFIFKTVAFLICLGILIHGYFTQYFNKK